MNKARLKNNPSHQTKERQMNKRKKVKDNLRNKQKSNRKKKVRRKPKIYLLKVSQKK